MQEVKRSIITVSLFPADVVGYIMVKILLDWSMELIHDFIPLLDGNYLHKLMHILDNFDCLLF